MKTTKPLQRRTTMRQASPSRKAAMRKSRPKMTSARMAARGQPCMVRLPGCDGGGETTVLAHYALMGTSGMGMKPDDEQGAYCCARCHDIVDGRQRPPEGYERSDVRLAFAEGVFRTQDLIRRLAA